ncbi:MAG: nitrilase-related carbon-nitrogen hydrolase [Candidatus Binataceae bacterium]
MASSANAVRNQAGGGTPPRPTRIWAPGRRVTSRKETTYAAAAAITAILLALSTAFPMLWICGILAPLPVLALAPEVSTPAAAQFAFLAYLFAGGAFWYAEGRLMPPAMLLAGQLVGAAVFATAAAAAAEATKRWSGILASLTFPTIVTAFFFAAGGISPYGTWGDPAYLMAGFAPLTEVAAMLGADGITFIAWLVPSCLAVAWYRRQWHMNWLAPLIASGAIIGIAVIAGTIQLFSPLKAGGARIGMVALDEQSEGAKPGNIPAAVDLVDRYAKLVREAADQGAQAVVLPEKVVAVTPRYQLDVEQGFRDIASMSRVWLAAGFDHIDRKPMRNIVRLFAPDGRIFSYEEHHLKPNLELGYERGHRVLIVDPPWGKTAVVVASDLDFPDTVRELSAVGVKLVLAPAWGWPGNTAAIHREMVRVGGVEGGFAVASSGRGGVVLATDLHGRGIATGTASGRAIGAVAVANLRLGNGATLYSRGWGDWFGRLIILLAIVILARFALIVRRQILMRMQQGFRAPVVPHAAARQPAAQPEEAPKPEPKREAEPEVYHAMTRPPEDYE